MNQQSMQACVFERTGNTAVVQTPFVPVPSPREGELLVRMEASPIHPADLMFIAGRYRIKPLLPQIAGLEGCGTVLQDASDMGFAAGTRVAFRHPGCWAEYNVVPARKVSRVPPGVAAADACQYSLNAVTAWALLHECGAKRGNWIAINAASSTVAGVVRALAEHSGIRTVSIYRGQPPRQEGPAVSSDMPNLPGALLEATGSQPIVSLLDAIGAGATRQVLPALAADGVILSYGVLDSTPSAIGNPDLIFRNLTWKGFGIDHWLACNASLLPAMSEMLWRRIQQSELPLPVRSTHVLARVHDAFADAKGRGKVLLVPAADPALR
jgi:NADPH:quinone reductase